LGAKSLVELQRFECCRAADAGDAAPAEAVRAAGAWAGPVDGDAAAARVGVSRRGCVCVGDGDGAGEAPDELDLSFRSVTLDSTSLR